MRNTFTQVIDFFYPPFRRIFSKQTFRYAACGGFNTALGLLVFYIGFYIIFKAQYADLGFFVFEPHSAALLASSIVSFSVGFLLNKYVVFTASYLRGRVQLFRYLLTFVTNLIVNYFLLKLFVEYLQWNVMVSQIITIAIITLLSYILQKHFTFHSKEKG